MDWYLNLEAGMLFPVDPFYTEMYYVDFDSHFSMYSLNYVNNAGDNQMLEAFETREEALAVLTIIAKRLNAINYTEEEKEIDKINWDWDKYIPYVEPYPTIDPYTIPYVPFPSYYPPYIVTCITADTSDNNLVWYTTKGELYPIK